MPRLPTPAAARLLLAVGWLVVAGCSETPVVSDCVPGIDPSCEAPPGADEVVAGVNLTALFAAPTPAEVAEARATPPATEATVSVTLLEPSSEARRFLITLDTPDGDRILTAMAQVPGRADQTTRLPVVVVLTDGTDGASEADRLTDPSFGWLVDGAIQVVVAYRGETLDLLNRADAFDERSDVPPDPYRLDAPDVRTVLSALTRVPRADMDRIGLVGIGRGGTVALLAVLQGAPVRAMVTLGAPTDLFARSFRDDVRSRLLGGQPIEPYPALDALAAPALALQAGEATPESARLGLAARSPARLAAGQSLPALLALHASGDAVVGDDQLASLTAALRSAAGTAQIAELIEGVTHEGLLHAPSVQSRIADFLGATL